MNSEMMTRQTSSPRPVWAIAAGIVTVVFGVLTIISGGRALFGGAAARAAMGNAVTFVLWFNFAMGFLYIIAGTGLYCWRRWAAHLSAVIALTTLGVLVAFGWYVAAGGAYEMRTVGAMLLRSGVWIVIAFMSCRALGCRALR